MRGVVALVLCLWALGAGVGAAGAVPLPRVLRLVDRSRTIVLPGGRRVPRPIATYMHYPPTGTGPWPLVVFGHGFAATPGLYAGLLATWAEAGYVVAAPLFPLANRDAPGGPNESDIVEQPADMRFVITQLLDASASPGNPLYGLIDAARVAVAGQSDGAETALAAAYLPPYRDPRIDAAVILSGAQMPATRFAREVRVPLLAVQGTADTINPAPFTGAFFRRLPPPKYLLVLHGAGHIDPYTRPGPDLRLVERVTTAFLDRYLGDGSTGALLAAGHAPGLATLTAAP